MSEGTFQQLYQRGGDIYMYGNPENGCWRYGSEYGARNPYCPTLEYSIINNDDVLENNKRLCPKLKESFNKTYYENKILPDDFEKNHRNYLNDI